ncbi:MAG TPA: OmcA/MtrC family decaheme c-type cytochrome [Kofleriaceae bacterium]|nr:OmcA/MtrC family decaheme c-type cytochrome [Kofleriaceae bacterium]
MTGDTGATGEQGPPGQDGDTPPLPVFPWEAGPGLRVEIQAAAIDGDGVATVTYQLTDSGGTPLDSAGVYTDAAVSERFLLAWLGQDGTGRPLQYTSYLTRLEGTSTQATSESPPADDPDAQPQPVDIENGVFTYTFQAAVDVGDNGGQTHTVGMYATREVDGVTYVANATFDFVPDGSAAPIDRDVVATESCNGCHNRLEAHGGSRREVRLCILCHSPQTTDDETGNTLDFKVMVHKIHAGSELSAPYIINGYGDVDQDFSDIEFPRELRSCAACHDTNKAADAGLAMTRPSAAACGACHDTVDFVTGANHVAGAQPDSMCANINCHGSASLNPAYVHLYPGIDPASPVVDVVIDAVDQTAPGDAPEVSFTVTVDGTPRDILAAGKAMDSLRFTLAGPTTDYDYDNYRQATVQGTGTDAGATLVALTDGSDGKFVYTFPAAKAIADGVTGTFGMGVEGSIRLVAGGTRYATRNHVVYFSVDGSAVAERREVVDRNRCNSCHEDLAAHGGSRRDTQYCVMCHEPGNTNDERWAQLEDSTGVLVPTVDFKVMIHKIHRGTDLTQPYILGGNPAPTSGDPDGNPVDFGAIRFPGDLRSCGTCHDAGTFDLPLPAAVRPSRSELAGCIETGSDDGDSWCDSGTTGSSGDYWVTEESIFTPPIQSVCTACHDGEYTAAHAEVMTTSGGAESCQTCHGPGQVFDIANYHRTDP